MSSKSNKHIQKKQPNTNILQSPFKQESNTVNYKRMDERQKMINIVYEQTELNELQVFTYTQ